MLSIGLIAEGHTDQIVIKQVLLGIFGEDEPAIKPVQPPESNQQANGTYAPGGWTVLFRFLREGGIREALQFFDYVVVHVDTDVCEDPGFDVPRRVDGHERSPDDLAEAVEQRLIAELGLAFYQEHGSRILFAIAVDEVECWLLPLLFPSSPPKRSKTTGCLEAANEELRRRDATLDDLLERAKDKQPKAYLKLARSYRKPKDLARHEALNPNLHRFVVEARRLLVPPEGP